MLREISYRFLLLFTIVVCIAGQSNYMISSNSVYDNITTRTAEKVLIQVFYECLCPDCRNFDTTDLYPTITKLKGYIKVKTYPYGNANTNVDNNGTIRFQCQHGPPECYGNKLHACAIRMIEGDETKALLYNICMMNYSRKNRGSDDVAADECGQLHNIDSNPIKRCAKSEIGTKLLYHYGVESKKENFRSVPHVKVNGKQLNVDTPNQLFNAVCREFENPPAACTGYTE